jgi:type IV secretory pathway TrbF-like protein
MKQQPAPAQAAAVPQKSPYLNARLFWNDHTKGLMNAVRLWQTIALLCLMITLVAVGGTLHIASQSKFIPYVVEVDKLGQSVAVAPAQVAAPADERWSMPVLPPLSATHAWSHRTWRSSAKPSFSVFATLKSDAPATAKMTDWLNGDETRSPFNRAAKETVETEIISVLPQSPDTWQVEWNEKTFDRKGTPVGKPSRMRALLTVETLAPTSDTSEEKMRQNPLGIYVKDFSWSKQNG